MLAAYEPAGQVEHGATPVVENEPSRHGIPQVLAPGVELWPKGHAEQVDCEVAPVEVENLPAGHFAQLAEPLSAEYEPEGQDEQLANPAYENVPGTQLLQGA